MLLLLSSLLFGLGFSGWEVEGGDGACGIGVVGAAGGDGMVISTVPVDSRSIEWLGKLCGN